ncbi:hypothetical protein AGMMS49579_02560 [Spirochaetia bacterium]|nr:hypothetical protein AGMMS49579_02560 [Spirochaetia bacterium]
MKKFGPALMGLLAPALCGLLFTACPTDGGNGGPQNLPIKTIRFEPPTDGNGGAQFYTNDSQYYGYSFTSHFTNGSIVPGTFEVMVNRLSGNSSYGYGMIFGGNSSSGGDYYRLIITTNKGYQVRKRVGGVWTDFLPATTGVAWPMAAALNSGLNQNNTLKVVRTTNSPATFNIYFNGTLVTSFTDNSPIINTLSADTKFGLYAGVGVAADESFPNTPVDIRYTRGASTMSPSITSSAYSVSSSVDSMAE